MSSEALNALEFDALPPSEKAYFWMHGRLSDARRVHMSWTSPGKEAREEFDAMRAALAVARKRKQRLERVREIAEEIRDHVVARTMEVQRARMWDRRPGEWTRYERLLSEAVLAALVDVSPPGADETGETP